MIFGGGDPAINTAYIIDLKASAPAYKEVASMIHARFHINAVMLPDRTVFVSGGNGQSEAAATAVLEAEIYDPATNTWTAAATAQAARMYHSIALLLPDGRVSRGHNAWRVAALTEKHLDRLAVLRSWAWPNAEGRGCEFLARRMPNGGGLVG